MEQSHAPVPVSVTVPKYVFIVPYRDREPHRVFFSTYIYKIMEDVPPEDWTFFFVHQNDKRPFNRGGMKNIGFLALKNAYPNDYKNIIFIFNDIDTLPYNKNILNYHTNFGVIKHFYGFQFALGGIFSVRGADFERINGFPNYWAWGGEDNLIHERAKQEGIIIDRSNFFALGDMNILQFADGLKRLICRDELATSIMPNNSDGLSKLTNISYTKYDDTHMIDVTSFDTYIHYSQLHFEEQSLDKVSKIRVSPINAVRNIKQLQSEYMIDNKKQIHSIHSEPHDTTIRKIGTDSVNTMNIPIKANLPFEMNRNTMINRRNNGLFIPNDRPIINHQDRLKINTANVAENPVLVNRVYQNVKQNADIVIQLQRPPNVGTNLYTNKFGMRALFM